MNPLAWLAHLSKGLGVAGWASILLTAGTLLLLARTSTQIIKAADGLTDLLRKLLGPQWKRITGIAALGGLWWALMRSPIRGPVLVTILEAGGLAYLAGGVHYGRRYNIRSSPNKAWMHHWRTIAADKGFDAAAKAATGKDSSIRLVRRVELDNHTDQVFYEPPDGMSAIELADQINEGKWDSAIRRRVGRVVAGPLVATVETDGTVSVLIPHNPPPAAAPTDLGEVEWWTPPAR